MKSKKTIDEMDGYETSSVMRWGCGQEVVAYLDWDERAFYLWFEPTDIFLDWCEEAPDIKYLLDELNEEIRKIGVQEFYNLDEVNSYCDGLCGDDDPAYFYEDELTGICGV